MTRFLTASIAAVALVLFAGAAAQADPIPVTWSYYFTLGQSAIPADGLPANNASAFIAFTSKTGITNPSSVTTDVPSDGNSTSAKAVVLANLSAVAPSDGKTYTLTNAPWSVTMDIVSNGDTKALTFTGLLTGAITNNNNLQPVTPFSQTPSQSVTEGGYTFTVQLNGYTSPSDPGEQATPGAIGANVTVAQASNITPTSVTPEPSSMLLSGFGLTFLSGAAWRKRRQSSRTPVSA